MECPICLDPLKTQYGKTDCSHLYHVACIGTWSKISDKCPSCRKVVKSYNIIRHGKILKSVPWKARAPPKLPPVESPLTCCLCESPTSERNGAATCGECSRHFHMRCVCLGPVSWECPLCEASNEALGQLMMKKRPISPRTLSPEVSRIQQRFDRLSDSDYTEIVNRQKESEPKPMLREALDWQLFEMAKRGTDVDLSGLVRPPERKLKKRAKAGTRAQGVGAAEQEVGTTQLEITTEVGDGSKDHRKIILLLEHKKIVSKLLVRAFMKGRNLNDEQYTRINANVCKRFYRYIEFHSLWGLSDWLHRVVHLQGDRLDELIRKVRNRAKDVEPITEETDKWRTEFGSLLTEWIKQEVDKK